MKYNKYVNCQIRNILSLKTGTHRVDKQLIDKVFRLKGNAFPRNVFFKNIESVYDYHIERVSFFPVMDNESYIRLHTTFIIENVHPSMFR